jgi:sulfite exporter TauE/SafE/copper chaperone CopZ
MSKTISTTYSVSGTHCHACEVLIEKEIKNLPGVKSVEVSVPGERVKIVHTSGHLPTLEKLNQIFKESGYRFFTFGKNQENHSSADIFTSLLIVMGVFGLYFLLSYLGIFSSINVNSSSVLPAFFVFGLLAGFSTCAALVGGIVLSLSRQWQSLYSSTNSTFERLQPTLIFNLGRIISFTVLGAVLGYFGSFFRLSITAGSIITILVSLVMIVLGLQMLNVRWALNLIPTLPKSITGRFADEKQFTGKFMPLLMGGLTFFLPCGFTLTSQTLALASGSPFRGALIMLFFALGTFIPLLLIGYSSAVTAKKSTTSATFSQVAGILVLIFSLYNIYSQSQVLGFSLPTLNASSASSASEVNGVQVIKMDASASGYVPNKFQIKAGQKVRWEITDKGTSGCTNGVISKALIGNDVINLVPGTTSVKEFTAPTIAGNYRFSCWMGMISGSIEVIN